MHGAATAARLQDMESPPQPGGCRPAGPAPHAAVAPPRAALLFAGLSGAVWIEPDGTPERLPPVAVARRARLHRPLLCHARLTARRLTCDPFPAYDLLELFAFVRPASFCPPTPRGLADALALPRPRTPEGAALTLRDAAAALLAELAARGARRDPDAAAIAKALRDAGWPWGETVLAALGADNMPGPAVSPPGLRVWERLPEWSDEPPPAPPDHQPVAPTEARRRLTEILPDSAEARPEQADYASAACQAFAPRAAPGEPNVVLAEAGTGVGKTLGYIAPASLWAEKNRAPVWIATYTRNLQRQIDQELARLVPEPAERARQVVIRKGRENYLCLLNLEDAIGAGGGQLGAGVAVGLMARWAAATRDGDMVGGDFPGWLPEIAGRARTLGLADRRGECLYSACRHYRKCFIERGLRQARQARLVVANHALVLHQAALGVGEEGRLPAHYVFDEGHHLFDAADGAFAATLSGREGQELRRWLLGAEGRGLGSGRQRGLRRRLDELVLEDDAALEALGEIEAAAQALPGEGWAQRLIDGRPQGPAERFLRQVWEQLLARVDNPDGPYGLETETRPPLPRLLPAASDLDGALNALLRPLGRLAARLGDRLDEQAGSLDSDSRRRLEAVLRSLQRRGTRTVSAWIDMLAALEEETPEDFVDWFAAERSGGRLLDVGMHRHWKDPTRPFAEVVLSPAQGALITSATLTDGSGDPEADWRAAELRCGTVHLPNAAVRARLPSPFDYAGQTRIFIVTDVRKDDLRQVAAAYRELFLAAGGGGLGLFTAIARLRAVHAQIGAPLEQAGIELYGQHVDGLDTSTLIELFRAEEDSCLLGTDAVRDGVDVPGRALRLIAFDRVPWPRPDIRHRARRALFGGRAYDDMLTRLRLKQAYGRLIRQAGDRGVFVLLDPMMPSRLLGAFPQGAPVARVGLAEAVAATREFLAATSPVSSG